MCVFTSREIGNGATTSDTSTAYSIREIIGAVFAAVSSVGWALSYFFKTFCSGSNNISCLKNKKREIDSQIEDESEEEKEQIGSDLGASKHSSSHHTSHKEAFAPTPFSGGNSSSNALGGAFAEMARGNARRQADPASFTGANPMWSPPDPYERTSRTQGPKKGGRNKQPTHEEYLNHF